MKSSVLQTVVGVLFLLLHLSLVVLPLSDEMVHVGHLLLVAAEFTRVVIEAWSPGHRTGRHCQEQ